jgi:hypothetical protein
MAKNLHGSTLRKNAWLIKFLLEDKNVAVAAWIKLQIQFVQLVINLRLSKDTNIRSMGGFHLNVCQEILVKRIIPML